MAKSFYNANRQLHKMLAFKPVLKIPPRIYFYMACLLSLAEFTRPYSWPS